MRLREQVPDECVLVGESGIRTRHDVQRLEAAGVDAMLVGETLMASRTSAPRSTGCWDANLTTEYTEGTEKRKKQTANVR